VKTHLFGTEDKAIALFTLAQKKKISFQIDFISYF